MKKSLSVLDAVALIVGIVVGVGIFKTPSLVAANTGGTTAFLATWAMGGAVSLVGALCYAELATSYPHPGGEYHYLTRAFGRPVGFLFAWARMTVIQTGSIAMLAFVLGDYLSRLFPMGPYSSPLYASSSILVLTIINIMGIRQGKMVQNLLTTVKVVGLLLIAAGGVLFSSPNFFSSEGFDETPRALGLAMIFVLLTYGGWNEAAYVSAEVRGAGRGMVQSLMWGIIIITVIYVCINCVYVHVLGINSLAKSDVVAFDVMARIAGPYGAGVTTALIAISALGALNATIITGARTNYALGADFRPFRFLGDWDERTGTPVNGLIVQGAIALLLVALGLVTREGFVTMVEYTAPAFWLFFLLATLSLFALRWREPLARRPFRVPWYPFTPLIFCAVCVYMFVASIRYTGIGALTGVAVLIAGVPLLLWSRLTEEKGRR